MQQALGDEEFLTFTNPKWPCPLAVNKNDAQNTSYLVKSMLEVGLVTDLTEPIPLLCDYDFEHVQAALSFCSTKGIHFDSLRDVFGVAKVANYLESPELIDICVQETKTRVQGKSIGEIQLLFGIEGSNPKRQRSAPLKSE